MWFVRDEFDFVVVGVAEVSGVVILAAGVRVRVGEQQDPAVGRRGVGEEVEISRVAGVEGEVVHSWTLPIMLGRGQSR